jgi:hypothetical protein
VFAEDDKPKPAAAAERTNPRGQCLAGERAESTEMVQEPLSGDDRGIWESGTKCEKHEFGDQS